MILDSKQYSGYGDVIYNWTSNESLHENLESLQYIPTIKITSVEIRETLPKNLF